MVIGELSAIIVSLFLFLSCFGESVLSDCCVELPSSRFKEKGRVLARSDSLLLDKSVQPSVVRLAKYFAIPAVLLLLAVIWGESFFAFCSFFKDLFLKHSASALSGSGGLLYQI
jgi:hypothetical protein